MIKRWLAVLLVLTLVVSSGTGVYAARDTDYFAEQYHGDVAYEDMAYEPVDMDDLSYYDELINHTDKYVDLNLDLEAVLFEEANSYFDDEHDLDTAVELMENRVNTYLKEHK